MERRLLGRSGLDIGVIGMGTWRTFDVPAEDEKEVKQRKDVVAASIANGTNFFDSSPMYGEAEKVLGCAIGSQRSEVRIATKVWAAGFHEGRAQIESALSYFGGHVDLYQIHNLLAWHTHLSVLQGLRAEGVVGAVGVTDYRHSSFAQLARLVENEDIQSIQIPYNAADRLAERDLLPLAAARKVGVITMSPLGTGSLVAYPPPGAELERFKTFGVTTWAQVLLKWVVSDERVTTTIPATSRKERAAENAAAGQPPFFGPEERERVSWLARRSH